MQVMNVDCVFGRIASSYLQERWDEDSQHLGVYLSFICIV